MTLTSDDFRLAIGELIELFDAVPASPVDTDNTRIVQIAHGWATQIYRFAKAILVLADAGFEHETRVISRSMLEYTITLHWLVEVGDAAVDAVMREHQRSLRVSVDKADVGLEFPEEAIREILDVEVPEVAEQETLRHFEQVCQELDVAENLYIVYRVQCAATHPTFASASTYLIEDPGQEIPRFATHPPNDTGVIPLAATCLVWAGSSFDSLLIDHPLHDALERIAFRIETVPSLPARQP